MAFAIITNLCVREVSEVESQNDLLVVAQASRLGTNADGMPDRTVWVEITVTVTGAEERESRISSRDGVKLTTLL